MNLLAKSLVSSLFNKLNSIKYHSQRTISKYNHWKKVDFMNKQILKEVCIWNSRRQRGPVIKCAVIVIDNVSVHNLIAPFCFVLGKESLRYFPLIDGLGK